MVSNKTLAFLVIGAIVVSLFAQFVSIFQLSQFHKQPSAPTGYVSTGTGEINFTIVVATDIVLFNSTIDFGSGIVNYTTGTCAHANLTNNVSGQTAGNQLARNTQACWVNSSQAGGTAININDSTIRIQNDGNVNVTVTLDSLLANNATNFIGNCSTVGQENVYSYTTKINDGHSAYTCTGANLQTGWTNISSSTTMKLCDELAWEDASDAIDLAFLLHICASNLQTGMRRDTIAITSVAAP